MAMNIEEPWRDHEATHIQAHFGRVFGQIADSNDAITFNADIGYDGGFVKAVIDRTTDQDYVERLLNRVGLLATRLQEKCDR